MRLERNDQGVAHISAGDVDDAHFGLGFCHARDRGLQMLLVRILGQGRGCEQLQDTAEMLVATDDYRRRHQPDANEPFDFDEDRLRP